MSKLAPIEVGGLTVKVQYFGDVNDYLKFALLRLIAGVGKLKVGVCWMLTNPDGLAHGDNRKYLSDRRRWQPFDPELFEALSLVPTTPALDDLRQFEATPLMAGASFFSDTISDNLAERKAFHRASLEALSGCQLAFFDPDNGLAVKSVPKGRKRSSKYAFMDELAEHYQAGRSLLVYQHFPRSLSRMAFIEEASDQLGAPLSKASIWSFETPHVVFLLAARPEHATRIEAVALEVQRCWLPTFFRAVRQVG